MIEVDCRSALMMVAADAPGGIAAPSVSTVPQAAAGASGPRAPGFYRFRLGAVEIVQLSDGFFELPTESMATNAPADERRTYFEDRSIALDTIRLQTSPLLIDTGDRLVLVDSGVGPGADWAPGAGRLGESLAAAGVTPDAIDTVVLTHAHEDHIGGLVDFPAGKPRFLNAEVVLSAVELALWTAEDTSHLPEWAAAQGLDWHRSIFRALGDRVRPIEPGSQIVTGVQSMDSPGHTQGHISLLVGSGRDQLLITGDAVPNIHIAFEHPDWQTIWDHDRELAAQTRARLLDRMASDRVLVAGYHYPFPGIGRVVRDGNGYRWFPADWA